MRGTRSSTAALPPVISLKQGHSGVRDKRTNICDTTRPIRALCVYLSIVTRVLFILFFYFFLVILSLVLVRPQIEPVRRADALAGDDRVLLEDNSRSEENEGGRGRSVRGRREELAAAEGR